jgi:aspartate kinase
MGHKSVGMCGWQIDFRTDNTHSNALIESVDGEKIKSILSDGKIVVVPGFQGISDEGRITTLGRGGSDTSAIAIAAAVNAERCDIYTDVDGIYTADPRVVNAARRLNEVSYEEMLEMSSDGAKVLQVRSVALATKHNITTRVLSTFKDDEDNGTFLVSNDIKVMERRTVTGVVSDSDEVSITLTKMKNVPGMSERLFGVLSDENINVDLIIQGLGVKSDVFDIVFTVRLKDVKRTEDALNRAKGEKLDYEDISVNDNIAKVSIVGAGMKVTSGVAAKMFKILANENINILAISTSEIKISVLIEKKYSELAVRVLHKAFEI